MEVVEDGFFLNHPDAGVISGDFVCDKHNGVFVCSAEGDFGSDEFDGHGWYAGLFYDEVWHGDMISGSVSSVNFSGVFDLCVSGIMYADMD